MALLQHWACNDNAASTTVVATVGNNATLVGGDNTSAKTVAGPGGTIAAGLSLNGTDDYIDISGASLSFAGGVAFSVSGWMEFDAAGSSYLTGDSGTTAHRIFKQSDTNIRVTTLTGSSDFTVPSLGTSAWCHVLVARAVTTNSMRVFVNGVESSSGAQVRGGTLAPTTIGYGSVPFSDMQVAQIKVYDSDESANVATLYAEGVGAVQSPVPIIIQRLYR
jgi:hypothetical protein